MKWSAFFVVLITFLCGFASLWAQEFSKEFGFKSDNDAYLANKQDRYYTNGLFISYRAAANQSELKSGLNKKIYQLEIGQKIYNARSGFISDTRYIDRPIAAYLYLGGSMQWLYDSENSLTAGIQVGTIGPAALGRQAQEFIHRITGLYTPKGWEYQLNNEMGLNMNVAYNHFLRRSPSQKLDILLNSYANIGNTFTGMGLGFTLRAGKMNPFLNTAYNRTRIGKGASGNGLKKSELFFFAKPQLDLIIYDATVQGGLFNKNKDAITFEAKPWVLSQELGLMFSKNRFSAQFSYILKTPEIKSVAKSHRYGSIGTYYQFK